MEVRLYYQWEEDEIIEDKVVRTIHDVPISEYTKTEVLAVIVDIDDREMAEVHISSRGEKVIWNTTNIPDDKLIDMIVNSRTHWEAEMKIERALQKGEMGYAEPGEEEV